MKLKIHRGTNQIGGNIIEISSAGTRIILDCGRNLPPLDAPDDNIDIDGLTSGESAFDAVFITHYHADHCGLIGHVNADIPVYASEETKNVLSVISDFIDAPLPRISRILRPGEKITVGDIEILPIHVFHSAKGAMAFLIEADGKKLLYTGDFNHIDETYYSLLGKIDVLLCEGTNIEARNGNDESYVRREAARIMRETKGQVFVLCSATNIDRINAIERACRASGRTIAIDAFMTAISDAADNFAPLVSPVGFMPHYIDSEKTPRAHKYFQRNYQLFSGLEAVSKMTNLTFMVRQTMGDFLKKLDRITPLRDSTLIYSMWRGYENVGRTKEFMDLCRELGMRIEYLHVSGHAYREQLETAIMQLNPATVVPIHTESAESFSEMHDNVVILDNTDILEV